MKKYFSPIFYYTLLIAFSLTLLVAILPLQTYAHPSLGLTPTPTPEASTPMPTPTPPDPAPGPTPGHIDINLSCDVSCPVPGEAVSVSIPIQLVHPGSGSTIDTSLSNFGRTSVQVDFRGRWEVIMTGPPQVYPDLGVEYPSNYPVSLGFVEADGGNQTVNCPITPVCDVPEVFPQTGDYDTLPYVLIISILTIGVLLTTGVVSTKRARRRGRL